MTWRDGAGDLRRKDPGRPLAKQRGAVATRADGPDPPRESSGGDGVRPMAMFRWGLYVSLGVLTVLAAAAAVYTTRAVLVRVLIALLAALIGGTVLGLVGALMAIPVAAGLKVLLAEQLHARDAADTDSGASEDGEAVLGPAPADEGTPSPGGVPGGQA